MISFEGLNIYDTITASPGLLVLGAVLPSAIQELNRHSTQSHWGKDGIPAEVSGGEWGLNDLKSAIMSITAILLTIQHITLFLFKYPANDKWVTGSLLMSMLIGIVLHYYEPHRLMRPVIPTSAIWLLSAVSVVYGALVPHGEDVATRRGSPLIWLYVVVVATLMGLEIWRPSAAKKSIKPTKLTQ